MEGFSLKINVDPQGSRYRAHIVLWDGRRIESIEDSPEVAALALGGKIAAAMKAAGLPDAHLLALTPIPSSEN